MSNLCVSVLVSGFPTDRRASPLLGMVPNPCVPNKALGDSTGRRKARRWVGCPANVFPPRARGPNGPQERPAAGQGAQPAAPHPGTRIRNRPRGRPAAGQTGKPPRPHDGPRRPHDEPKETPNNVPTQRAPHPCQPEGAGEPPRRHTKQTARTRPARAGLVRIITETNPCRKYHTTRSPPHPQPTTSRTPNTPRRARTARTQAAQNVYCINFGCRGPNQNRICYDLTSRTPSPTLCALRFAPFATRTMCKIKTETCRISRWRHFSGFPRWRFPGKRHFSQHGARLVSRLLKRCKTDFRGDFLLILVLQDKASRT